MRIYCSSYTFRYLPYRGAEEDVLMAEEVIVDGIEIPEAESSVDDG